MIHAGPENREAGLGLLLAAHDYLSRLSNGLRRIADVEIARCKAMAGDFGGAITMAEAILAQAFATGEMFTRGAATTVLVEALLARGRRGDLRRARAAVDRLAAVPTEPRFALHEIAILRLRGLLARTAGKAEDYQSWVRQYRSAAERAEFSGHVAAAESMGANY